VHFFLKLESGEGEGENQVIRRKFEKVVPCLEKNLVLSISGG